MNTADSSSNLPRIKRWRRFAGASGMLAMLIAALVLLGWMFDLPLLTSMLPGATPMKANTAAWFMLAGLAVWLLAPMSELADPKTVWRSRVAASCAGLVSLLGAVTLAQDIFGVDFGIDNLIVEAADPRMAASTAVAFMLLGLALLLRVAHNRSVQILAESCALAAALIGLLALVGYAYNVEVFHRVYGYTSMALHTALLFVLLGFGALCIRLDRGLMTVILSDYGGGFMARRILPLAIGLPFVLGWLRWRGELLGLYDTGFGLALFATSNILIFSALVMFSARMVNNLDRQHHAASTAVKESEQRLRDIFDGLGPDMLVGLLSPEGILLEVNRPALEAAGQKREDAVGMPVEETFWLNYSATVKQQFREAIVRAAQGEASRFDVQIRVAENKFITIDYSLQPFRDITGKVVQLISSANVITERVKAEQALRESEAKLRAIIESSPVALAMNDQHGNVTLLNRKFIETFGYTLADIPTLDKWWLLAYPDPAYRQRVVREWQVGVEKAQRDQTELEPLEYSVTCADGSVRDILFSMAPMDGFSLVIFYDITERKRAEREREQLFAQAQSAYAEAEALRKAIAEMFNRVSDAFVSLDKDWCYTYVNNQAAAMFGRPPGQLLGKHIWTEFPEGFGQPFHLAYEKAMAEQLPVFFEDYYPPYDRWFENRIYPSPDGLTIYFHDITERKRAVEALRESEERLRLALDAAHMGTFDWDVHNDLITWSRWHAELWGFKPDNSGNTFEVFAKRVHPEDMPGINAEIARCIAAREPFMREWRVVWPDGSTHWISSRGEFTFSSDGQPLHMRGVVAEITKRKQAEILLSGEKVVLEMIVEGTPLSEILDAITRSVEAVSGDSLCSILLLDAEGIRLQHGAAPSLPPDYNRAVHGEKIGPQAGSCGTAVYLNQPVIVTDIATDPLWENYRALALAQGLRACWSTPIRSTDGRVMGSFALYYHEPRTPGPADFELIARMTPLAAIAIERRRAEQALRESEAHFHALFDQAPDGIFISDAQGKFLDVNIAGCHQFAYSRDEFLKLNITDILAVEEVPRLAPERARLKDGNVAHSEWLCRRSDGSVFSGELSAKQLPDGCVQAFLHDITGRKQAEAALQAHSRELQALSKRVLEVQEAERRHVARELHDELGQILTALKINLQARNRLNGQSPVEIDSANIGMVEDAISHVRRLALALRPPMIDDLGLLPALHWAVEQSIARAGLAVQWQSDLTDQRLAPEIETACFRIAQEAFTNIMRHAQARNVKVEVQHAGDQLLLTVQDDGCGFDVAAMRARATAGISIGVLGMQERATLAGGELQIESVPGQGTTIRARFPWLVLGEGRTRGEDT